MQQAQGVPTAICSTTAGGFGHTFCGELGCVLAQTKIHTVVRDRALLRGVVRHDVRARHSP